MGTQKPKKYTKDENFGDPLYEILKKRTSKLSDDESFVELPDLSDTEKAALDAMTVAGTRVEELPAPTSKEIASVPVASLPMVASEDDIESIKKSLPENLYRIAHNAISKLTPKKMDACRPETLMRIAERAISTARGMQGGLVGNANVSIISYINQINTVEAKSQILDGNVISTKQFKPAVPGSPEAVILVPEESKKAISNQQMSDDNTFLGPGTKGSRAQARRREREKDE